MPPPDHMLCSETSRRAAKIPWTIKPHALYKIFSRDDTDEESITGTLLVEVAVTGWITGEFQWILTGSKLIEAQFSAADITGVPGVSDFTLSLEARPEDIRFRPNLLSGEWEDLADMVAKGQIIASRGDEDDGHDFLGKL